MPNAVVILGAGASADFGVPTLRGVFQDLHAQRYLRADNTLRQKLEQIFWQPRGHTLQTSDQSLTIEEMLTILRDWEREADLPARPSREELEDFKRRLYVLIYNAVFEGKSTKAMHLNGLIHICRRKFTRVTWASFNWDCVFEGSFWYSSGGPGPVGGRHNPTLAIHLADWRDGNRSQEYLKLHGSINWWVIGGQLSYLSFGRNGSLSQRWTAYSRGQSGADFPVILEPSSYKYGDEIYKLLEPQWQQFFSRLCEADCVIILGYSLPDGDYQARSKILSSFQANPKGRWMVVDPSQDACAKYRRLLGQRRVTILDKTLAGLNNNLAESLQGAFDNVDFSDPPPPAAAKAGPAN